MRIIAGGLRGRALQAPPDRRVRPTADRVREAWFSIVADALPGAHVLDLYAGSGALGLEALSRGAERTTFVELNAGSIRVLRANIDALGVADRAEVRRGDALKYAGRLAAGAFDIAFADPPYTIAHAPRLIMLFRECPFARILGIEHAAESPLEGDDSRRYGTVSLTFVYAP